MGSLAGIEQGGADIAGDSVGGQTQVRPGGPDTVRGQDPEVGGREGPRIQLFERALVAGPVDEPQRRRPRTT